jgi:PAS domain S-box-containing protein
MLEAEEVLKRSEERFRLAVEAMPSVIIAVDHNGKISLVNSRAEDVLGYRKEELLGYSVEMLIPERFRNRHIKDRQNFLTHPISRFMGIGRDLFCLRKDGHEIPVEIGLAPYQSSEGSFTLALIVDITERKTAELA